MDARTFYKDYVMDVQDRVLRASNTCWNNPDFQDKYDSYLRKMRQLYECSARLEKALQIPALNYNLERMREIAVQFLSIESGDEELQAYFKTKQNAMEEEDE